MYDGYLRLFGALITGYIEEACKPGKSNTIKDIRREAYSYLHHNIYIELFNINIDKLIEDYLKSNKYKAAIKEYERNLVLNRERSRRRKGK